MWRSNRGQWFIRKLFQVSSGNKPTVIVAAGNANQNARGSEPLFWSKISNANSPNNSSSAKSNVKRKVAWFLRWLLVFTMFTEKLQIKCQPKIYLHLKVIANTHKKELWKSSAASATEIRHFYSHSSVIDFFLKSFIFRSVREVMFSFALSLPQRDACNWMTQIDMKYVLMEKSRPIRNWNPLEICWDCKKRLSEKITQPCWFIAMPATTLDEVVFDKVLR